MNYQAMNGQGGSPSGMGMDPMGQHSSHKTWYVVGAVVLIVIAGALWYLYGSQAMPSGTQNTAVEQTPGMLSPGNTTADILSDLSQTIDDSAGLDQAAASSAAAVQGF
ncbi:MAG: hypothetical protein Q7J45_03635 [bacterium]|nr:hypothetical protein [bacterium]